MRSEDIKRHETPRTGGRDVSGSRNRGRETPRTGGRDDREPRNSSRNAAVYTAFILVAASTLTASITWNTISAAPAREEESVTDKEIVAAVESQLWTDEATDANRIDVNSLNGIVTLTGEADNILAKERAERICEVTVGVRGVVNRLDVEPLTVRTDTELRDAVKIALFSDPATEGYEVTVDANAGVVTLEGTVDSWQEKQLCSTVVKGVRGVREVENRIDVETRVARSDYEIKQEVEGRLANDVRVDDYLIEVEVENGKVALTGTVGSLQEKSLARMDSWVAGVRAVDVSDLEIKWWARDTMRRKDFFTSRGDDEIERAVKDAFLYDPRVLSFEPEVEVEDGIVTLTGTVDNWSELNAAENNAYDAGAKRVNNRLVVRNRYHGPRGLPVPKW